MISKPYLIIGAGGHGKVVWATLTAIDAGSVLAFADAHPPADYYRTVPIFTEEDAIERYPPPAVWLANGIGGVGKGDLRRRVFERFAALGYYFPPIVHPSAILATGYSFAAGVQVMAGVVLQPDVTVGANTILNTRAAIDHDSTIGAHVHIAPGAVLSGGVVVGDGAHIGTGAVIIQGITIGEGAVVGAGAAVVHDVAPFTTVVGVPARMLKRS